MTSYRLICFHLCVQLCPPVLQVCLECLDLLEQLVLLLLKLLQHVMHNLAACSCVLAETGLLDTPAAHREVLRLYGDLHVVQVLPVLLQYKCTVPISTQYSSSLCQHACGAAGTCAMAIG